ncbi:MAG TPA: histidine phosphatase family protein [Sporichthyaceae bacterium]
MAERWADDTSHSALAANILTKVTTELWLVRHGAVDREFVGADPPLSAGGHEQAKVLADVLSEVDRFADIDAIHCSPMLRARQTAEPLAGTLRLPVVTHEGLAEFDRNATEYMLLSELRARGDVRFEQVMAGDLSAWGTDWPTFRNEAVVAVHEVAASVDGFGVVFTHGGIINALVGVALGHDQAWLSIPEHASLTRFGVSADGKLKLLSLNETWHLRGANHEPVPGH